MPDIITAATAEDYKQARELLREYQLDVKVEMCFQGFEDELGELEHVYGPPGGALLLVRQGGRTAGCVALKDLGSGTCEINRLFLRPGFRGMGLGRICAEQAVQTARGMDYSVVRLHTLPIMREALALYRSMGFTEIAAYGDCSVEGAVFMEMDLGTG